MCIWSAGFLWRTAGYGGDADEKYALTYFTLDPNNSGPLYFFCLSSVWVYLLWLFWGASLSFSPVVLLCPYTTYSMFTGTAFRHEWLVELDYCNANFECHQPGHCASCQTKTFTCILNSDYSQTVNSLISVMLTKWLHHYLLFGSVHTIPQTQHCHVYCHVIKLYSTQTGGLMAFCPRL